MEQPTASPTKMGKDVSEKFLHTVRNIVAGFNHDMGEYVKENSIPDDQIKIMISENVKKSYSGSVSVSIEIFNALKYKSSKIFIIHNYNNRNNQKSIVIMNAVSGEIMFSYVGENATTIFQSYLSDILFKNFKYVLDSKLEKEKKTEEEGKKDEQ